MQYLSRSPGSWQLIRQEGAQPTQVSGPSTAQTPVAQTYVAPQEQQIGGQTLAELLKQQQPQTAPFGQNYLRQFMAPSPTNYFQQLY